MSNISDALHGVLAGQEAARKADTWFEREIDPEIPGRTKYRIHGPRKGVQAVIDRFLDSVETGGGSATFLGPYRNGDEYLAIGEVVQ